MRIRYQTNPKVALFGLAVSLGLIFGAQELTGVHAAQKVQADVENVHEVIQIAPVSTVSEAAVDRRAC